MSEIFQARCPFCGHSFKTRLAQKLTANTNAKVTCPKCQEKSVPADIDGNGTKVLTIPEQDTPQADTASSRIVEDSYSDNTDSPPEEQVRDSQQKHSEFLDSLSPSSLWRLVEFISETPVLLFNTAFIGLWVAFVIGASNNPNGYYDEVINFFSRFADGISGFLGSLVVLVIFMIPGVILFTIKEEKIHNDELKDLFGTTTNLASLALILFIGLSFISDYSVVQRKGNLIASQHKAKVLLALHDNNCNLADDHYQKFKEARGSDHEKLATTIQACLFNQLENGPAN
ncbi:MAG: hypothetical protein GQ475_05950 [Methylococcaceae bacterium]|nr:hypothetical protein [Methylococcaceae bacterium]